MHLAARNTAAGARDPLEEVQHPLARRVAEIREPVAAIEDEGDHVGIRGVLQLGRHPQHGLGIGLAASYQGQRTNTVGDQVGLLPDQLLGQLHGRVYRRESRRA